MLVRKDFINTNYNTTVKFILTDELNKTLKRINKKHKLEHEDCDCEGIVVTVSSELFYLIIDISHFSWNTLFHEVNHLSSAICKLRNIEDEESISWTSGWIGGELAKLFKTKKLEPSCG